MFLNSVKIALRNFWSNKLFTIINIAGLAIGICASLVIYLIVQYEFNFDKFHVDGDRIYRVVTEIKVPDITIHNPGVPIPISEAMRSDVVGIESISHFITLYDITVSVPHAGNQSPAVYKNQKNVIYADDQYFSLFKYKWLAGSPLTALNDPYQVVLTESRATVYFGNTAPKDVVGQKIFYNDSLSMVIAGVVKDIDLPTDFEFKEFISRKTLEKSNLKNNWNWEEWGSINSASQLFVKVSKGVNTINIENQLVELRKKYFKNVYNNRKDEHEKKRIRKRIKRIVRKCEHRYYIKQSLGRRWKSSWSNCKR